MESGHRTRLERLDAILFEQNLQQSLERIIPFESHSIIFPREHDAVTATWSEEEKKILLPIPGTDNNVLGIFSARGVDSKKAKNLLAIWEGVAPLVRDNLLNYKKSLCDPITGLFTRDYLLSMLEKDLDAMRSPPTSGTAASLQLQQQAKKTHAIQAEEAHKELLTGSLLHRSNIGDGTEGDLPRIHSAAVLIIRLAALRDVVREYGYQLADALIIALADSLIAACPEQAVAAKTGDVEFAIGLRSATKKSVEKLANTLIESLSNTSVEHSLRKGRVGIRATIGFSLFPQDLTGKDFMSSPSEQTRILLRKARLAAALADEYESAKRVMGFGQILAEGGRIIETLPLSRVIVSLGSNMHAKEGQRFSVWAVQNNSHETTPLYKGEIALMDVKANTSQAEIIHLGDPAWDLEKEDRLVLLPEEQRGAKLTASEVLRHDPVTGLLRHGDFLAQWAIAREKQDTFSLAVSQITPLVAQQKNRENFPEKEAERSEISPLSNHPDQLMAEVATLFRETFGENILGGRYGLNSLVFFHPDLPLEQIATSYKALAETLADRLHLQLVVGIAPHPFLDFRKSDALENCQKALEYGSLLPRPHIGILDSLALNISADKRFSKGETFAAIKEYQRALWVDEKNALAWNSLGICYAGLGRFAEAEEYFSKALACNEHDPMALYNLGFTFQSSGEKQKATEYFNACLTYAPDHLFSLIRLGQMAEESGNIKEAKQFFEKASQLPGGKGITFRHFARISLDEGNEEDAREHLHSALIYDPQDAVALQMLATLYLDAEEDSHLALSLARQSVSLRPELTSGWVALSRALEALGKIDEARKARLKSGQV